MDLTQKAAQDNGQEYAQLIRAWLASYGSDNTRTAYRNDVLLFLEYLDASGLDLLEVRRSHVDVFARVREQDGDSAATTARRLAAVSSLYRYAVTEGRLSASPADHVRRPTVDQDSSTTAALTRREAEDLLTVARMHSPRAGALVDLLLTTGMRISEALTARVSGLSSDRVVITRKGGKTAAVWLPDHTVEALRAITETTGEEITRGDELDGLIFTTGSGNQWDRTDVAKLLRRLGRHAGISRGVTPHVLRHTHATLALELGVPLHHLQDSLGHKDPRTTRRYDHARSRLENSSAHKVGALFGP
ncbi:tyrosine-type recombinase/integrase [Kocuria sp. CPCC 205235]|uniref:tyrosine-type recombinase/integrase n=1 Tax=Kocuria sp. CPCC 205235 TaxID=3073549 RepID=UPI0034D607B6